MEGAVAGGRLPVLEHTERSRLREGGDVACVVGREFAESDTDLRRVALCQA